MGHQKGSTVAFQMGYEATFGGGASAGYTLPINSFNLKSTRTLIQPATLTGTRNPAAPVQGNLIVEGDIVVPACCNSLPYWFMAAFREPTSLGNEFITAHSWTLKTSNRSLAFETAFTDLATAKYQRFVGCKIAGISITAGGDGELTFTFNIVGRSDSIETSSMDSSPTAISLSRINNFSCSLTEGGATLSNATEVTININFPMTRYYVIGGSGSVGSLAEEIIEVTGNLKTLFENTTLMEKAIAGTETSLWLTGEESSSCAFSLGIDELIYERNSVPVPGPQGLLVDLNFRGYYTNNSYASAIVATVTNAVASYTDTSASASRSPSSSASASRSPSASISPSSSASPSS